MSNDAFLDSNERDPARDRRWRTLFEDRHGAGAFEQLLADLQQPCLTFAAIAKRFNVSRERVRQWQMRLLPDAPRGHERQRQCAVFKRRQRLMQDPLFRDFYRHVRSHVAPGRIELIKATDGYRSRAVRVDQRTVVLRTAQLVDMRASAGTPTPVYRLTAPPPAADLVYYRLSTEHYLLVPVRDLPARAITFVDREGSRLGPFKNNAELLN